MDVELAVSLIAGTAYVAAGIADTRRRSDWIRGFSPPGECLADLFCGPTLQEELDSVPLRRRHPRARPWIWDADEIIGACWRSRSA